MKSRWKQYLFYASIIFVGGGLIFILIETVRAKNTGFETKTLWDWMQLLIIPLALAIGVFYLNRSERNNEREIATDRQQEAALQSYIDRIADLLLEDKLLTSENTEMLSIAKIRTLTVLRGLNATRNDMVLRFLRDVGLTDKKESDFLLNANLQGARLENVDLENLNLQGANLQGANMRGANLRGVNLRGANLINVNLQGAFLYGTDLQGANLKNANLRDSILQVVILKDAYLRHTIMPSGKRHD